MTTEKGERPSKILCVGLICVDVVSITKHYPDEGSDYRLLGTHWQKGGNAANSSAVLSILGNKVDFFGAIPIPKKSDIHGTICVGYIKDRMDYYNVGMDNVVERPGEALPFSTVLINNETGSRTILHYRKGLQELLYEDFKKVDISEYSWIHFEGRNIEEVVKMIDRVVKYNDDNCHSKITISVELEKPRRANSCLLLPHADLAVISQDYAEFNGQSSAIDAVDYYRAKCKKGASVVCAWGSAGAASGVAGLPKSSEMTDAFPPERVVDTLGAGDTFLAGLVHSVSRGHPLLSSVKFACRLAGCKVGFYGYEALREFNYTNGK
uniref:ketohexokinase isoform X1 n=1 Tax=Ciona intestinalis TaxID=7719 RepID=UPI00005231B7|nr:ketohexokinase isoform X1 [Ciona intestinalis]XP_026696254.1 ketohexokinase isoform X1 [Ciona intestinalis]|eukprot:XP_002123654.1 ketohexokinase isoform X1 [Ciona intestinalis]